MFFCFALCAKQKNNRFSLLIRNACLNFELLSSVRFALVLMAGKGGFEPPVEFYPNNHLAGGPIQPLWHLPNIAVFHE